MMKSLSMGYPSRQRLLRLLRVWLAGTAIALAPLLLLEDLDYLLRELVFSPKFWPDWVSVPISMALGVVVAAWVGLRHSWEAVPRWELAAERVIRFGLLLILSPYALSKVLGTQFRLPYAALDTALSDANGYALTWRFFGYSHGHEIFVALGEWIGPALLLSWRTTTLGACITAVVMANVVAVNFTHDLPVQRFSSCLLALTLYLLVLDGQRLLGFFVLNQPVDARPRPTALIRPHWLRAGAKAGWVALALGYSFLVIVVGDSKATPIAGAWTVEPSGTKPSIGWNVVYFERGFQGSYPGSIRRDPGVKPETFRYEFDAASQHLRMTFLNTTSPEKSFDGGYEVEDGSRLRLRGLLDKQSVGIELLRKR